MDIYTQLERDEGLRLKPYRDTVGKLTIGVGRNLDDVGISVDEAYYLLKNDVQTTIDALHEKLPWTYNPGLSNPRFYVLVNMAFNLGVSGLLGFRRFFAAVEAGDWEEAAMEMLDSKWAAQVGNRAHRLAKQMRSGEWV